MPIPVTPKKNDNVWFDYSDKPYVVSEESRSYLYREMNIERRQEKRFSVEEGVYCVIDSYAPQICQVMNFGFNGLSYVYFKGDDSIFESMTMDILVKGFGFCLERIPFKKVADYKADDDTAGGQFEKRVACIEFVDLSEAQLERIYDFIENHVDKTVN